MKKVDTNSGRNVKFSKFARFFPFFVEYLAIYVWCKIYVSMTKNMQKSPSDIVIIDVTSEIVS